MCYLLFFYRIFVPRYFVWWSLVGAVVGEALSFVWSKWNGFSWSGVHGARMSRICTERLKNINVLSMPNISLILLSRYRNRIAFAAIKIASPFSSLFFFAFHSLLLAHALFGAQCIQFAFVLLDWICFVQTQHSSKIYLTILTTIAIMRCNEKKTSSWKCIELCIF